MKQQKKREIRLDPALKAALILLLPSLVIRIVATALGYAVIGAIIQLILFVMCGYMAASSYFQLIRRTYPRGRPQESVRCGAKSGITLGILLTVLIIILGVLAYLVAPVGLLGLTGGITLVFLVPVDIIGGLFLGALGGKLSASSVR